MKTLSTITGTENKLINAFVGLTLGFIAVTLLTVAYSAFNDLTLLNRAF